MKIETITEWNGEFFSEFKDFRNLIHKDIETSFPEELEDYDKYFGTNTVFNKDFNWCAFIVRSDEKIVAKAILCHRKTTTAGNLGFIDWIHDHKVAQFLIHEVEKKAKELGLKTLKTPVDLNFFVKYRMRVPGGEAPVWGEPIYPDYYHDLFKTTGFKEIGWWDTYRLKKLQGIIDYFLKRKKLAKKSDGSHSKTKNKKLRTTTRCVRMDDWENELRIIHSLFSEAYKTMPEFEPITFDQFKIIYDDFKYIINPWYCYIVELRGKPVGFSINYADPLPVLKKYKGKKLSTLMKLKVLAELRLNQSCFMIAHVGKVPGPDGEEIKGVQIQVSKRIQVFGGLMKKVLVTFQNVDSPSRRSFETRSQTLYAQYVLYGKDL